MNNSQETMTLGGLMQIVVDFGRILRYLTSSAFKRWYIVLATTFVVMVLGVLFARTASPQYSSSMIIAPSQSSQLSALGSRAGQLAALTSSLSSFGLSGLGASQQFQTYLEILQSQSVAAAIMANRPMLSELFGGLTDPKTGQFVQPRGAISRAVYGLFRLTPTTAPTIDDVTQQLNAALIIETSADNPNLATLRCSSTIPDFCPRFLRFVDNAAEAQMSAVTLNDARNMARYITDQLPHIQQQEVRDALSDLLANAVKQIAIAQLHQSQGAVILSGPYTSPRPSFPQPKSIIVLTGAAGFFLGIILAWFFTETQYDVLAGRRLMALSGRLRPLP